MSQPIFVPYQIDYQVTNKAKTFGASKKKITFKFGIANQQAINDGMNGADCRGTEHEIVFTWSLNSGKRQIICDGKEVHYSETFANGWTTDRTFQHVFNIKRQGGSEPPIRCHIIAIPVNEQNKYPFNLKLNGVSYFDFCKIYEIGTPAMYQHPQPRPYNGSSGGGHVNSVLHNPTHDPDVDPYASPEERRAIAQAKLESLRDLRNSQGGGAPGSSQPPPKEESLISFDDPAPNVSNNNNSMPPGGGERTVSAMTMDTAIMTPPEKAASKQFTFNSSYTNPNQPQPPPQQQQQPQGGMYGSQTQYPGAPPPPGANMGASGNALTPWQPATGGVPGSAPGYAVPPPAAGNAGLFAGAAPPAAPYGAPPPAQQPQGAMYGAPPPQQPPAAAGYGYGGAPPQQNFAQQPQPQGMMSPSAQSIGSYGSTPSFAQPPQYNQQQQQRQYGY